MSSKSYIGAKVRLLRDHRTQGGTTFRKGVVMKVWDSTSGGLSLGCYVRGWGYHITGVSKRDVEVIEWKKAKGDDE